MAQHASDAPEHGQRSRHADYWRGEVNTWYTAIVASVRASVPDAADVEPFRPVRPLSTGQVEVHARDHTARPIVLRLTGPEALARLARAGEQLSDEIMDGVAEPFGDDRCDVQPGRGRRSSSSPTAVGDDGRTTRRRAGRTGRHGNSPS
ncbi:hypothetical protein [Dactylosporangium sp. CA-233914]|uniref:hypothetical protein n=1 Tax=Dactylosporangium sp. CA-233914 TaxID=3239934 RepID=UPI003D8F93C2